MLRTGWAAAVTWLPLLAYAAVTLLGADGGLEHYAVTAGLLGASLSSPATGAAAWLSLVSLIATNSAAAAARTLCRSTYSMP